MIKNKVRVTALTISIQRSTETLGISISQDREIKGINEKEINLTLFVDDMTLTKENLKTHKIIRINTWINRVAGYKVTI